MKKMEVSLHRVGLKESKINYKFTDASNCVCGNCNSNIGLDVFLKFGYRVEDTTSYREKDDYYYEVGQCPVCGKPVIHDVKNDVTYPPSNNFELILHLPEDIDRLYNEMSLSYAVGGYTCVVITARTMISHIAIEKGANENSTFKDYVDYLVKEYFPSSSSTQWIDKIRTLANLSVHHLKIANKRDAELCMKFTVAILKNIYEFPNSV